MVLHACQPEDDELSELSDMDEDEAGLYLHTKEESKLKEVIWTELNKEYLEKMSAKQAAQEAAQAKVGGPSSCAQPVWLARRGGTSLHHQGAAQRK